MGPLRIALEKSGRGAAAPAGAAMELPTMISIFQAGSRTQLDDARALMRGFVAWHRAHHAEDAALIDRYFDAAAFEAELAGLPGKYAPPAGRLLVAYRGGQPAGCAALRDLGGGDLGGGDCEMKRLFVPEAQRGHGIGRALAKQILSEARSAGYRRLRLDTSWRQAAAIDLYDSLGFRRVAPYYELPPDLAGWLVFFEVEL